MVGFFGISFILYGFWGNSQEFKHVKAYQTISSCLDELTHEKELTLEGVLTRLNGLSDNIAYSHKGLVRLAGIYSELGRYEESIQALEKAIELSPETAEYQIQWIYHQAFSHQGKLPEPVRAKAKALTEHKEVSLAAKNMLAMDDYFNGNYESALNYWDDILENDKTLTPERRLTLEKAVANAKAKMVGSARS